MRLIYISCFSEIPPIINTNHHRTVTPDINLSKGKNRVPHPLSLLQFRRKKWTVLWNERSNTTRLWIFFHLFEKHQTMIDLKHTWKNRGDKKSQCVALDMLPKFLFQQAVSLRWQSASFSPSFLCVHIISWLCKCTAELVHVNMKIKTKHKTELVLEVVVSSVCHPTKESLLVWVGGQYFSMRVRKILSSGSRWSSSFLLQPFPAQHALALQLTFLSDSPCVPHVIPGFVILKFRIQLKLYQIFQKELGYSWILGKDGTQLAKDRFQMAAPLSVRCSSFPICFWVTFLVSSFTQSCTEPRHSIRDFVIHLEWTK